MKRKVNIVILAAGASQRLGEPKQLVSFMGQSLLRRAACAALAAQPADVLCVLGAFAARLKPELAGLAVRIVENSAWQEGIASSIRVGVAASDDADAVLLMLSDQPLIDAAFLCQLITVWQESDVPIVASQYGKVAGAPALFARTLFPELLTLQGDTGARALLARFSHRCVPCPQGALDIDTPHDKHLLQTLSYRSDISSTLS